MKILIASLFLSFLFNPALAAKIIYKDIESLRNNEFSRLSQEVERNLIGSGVGDFEVVHRFEVLDHGQRGWEAIIEKVLRGLYLDEIEIIATENQPEVVEEIVETLNFNGVESAEDRLRVIKDSLSAPLKRYGLALYILESNGFGTFGEGNGFAIVDVENDQGLIVVTGIAE